MKKKLSSLLNDLFNIPFNASTVEISGICSDSRNLQPGDLFIACRGLHVDGRDFIAKAIEKKAAAVLFEKTDDFQLTLEASNIPLIPISQLSEKVGSIGDYFFDRPSKNLRIIGVTGTNGKTTCTQLISEALNQAGEPCGIIGTLGYGFPHHLKADQYTTPDPISLQQQLFSLKQQGANTVVMEVSSHALSQSRTAGTSFNIALFTNLSRDHLDYHQTMEDYWKAKQSLFKHPGLDHAIVNLDDEHGQILAEYLNGRLPVTTYSIENPKNTKAAVCAQKIRLNNKGIQAEISTPWGEGMLKTALLGRFNLSNLLASLSALCLSHVPFETALSKLSKVKQIPGRMQMLGGKKQPLIVIDFAHTPDALKKALQAIREHTQGKLWCIFGCGGNRDHGKRPMMGEIAERYSDQLIITDDNPRSEDPDAIIQDIMSGLTCPWAAEVEHNRQAAIAHAVDCASPADIILIAGKGHERYQHMGDKKIPFNDFEQAKQALEHDNLLSDY